MTNRYDSDRTAGRSSVYAQNLRESVDNMHNSRRRVRIAKSYSGEVPDNVHRDLENAVMMVYDELLPFTVENEQISKLWDEGNIDKVAEVCSRVHYKDTTQTAGGRVSVESSVEIERAPIPMLIRVSHTFDMIATKLGFNVDTSKARKRGVISLDG